MLVPLSLGLVFPIRGLHGFVMVAGNLHQGEIHLVILQSSLDLKEHQS